jgi:hypothetical protein
MTWRTIADGKYVYADVGYEYFGDRHLAFLGFLIIPNFLLWVFVFPITNVLILMANKDKL